MAPTIVYRVEHRGTGDGPWSGWYGGWDAGYKIAPSMAEGLRVRNGVDFHGFTNPTQLNLFSRRDRRGLRREGFDEVVYMAPPGTVKYGESQVLFDKEKAIKVNFHRMTLDGRSWVTIREHKVWA